MSTPDSGPNTSYQAPAGTTIGHVHLRVADVDRAASFYSEALGLDVIARISGGAFLSAGGYHHHVGLNQWYSRGSAQADPMATGLERFGIQYESIDEVLIAVKRVLLHGGSYLAAVDLGVGIAVGLRDPDGNGIELYCDRSLDSWSRNPDGRIQLTTVRIDIDEALVHIPTVTTPVPPTTRIGHVQLKVADLDRQIAFYRDVLGFAVTFQDDFITWLSAGEAHHLIGLVPVPEGSPRTKPQQPGLFHLAILYPTRNDLATATRQMIEANAGFRMAEDHGVSEAVYFLDPENNGIELFWDRPRDEWQRNEQGGISMDGGPLDLMALLAEAG